MARTKADQRKRDSHELLRAKILDAEVVQFLIRTAILGEPMPLRSPEGEIVSYERISPEARIAIADKLAAKVLPNLSSVSVEAADGAAGITFQLLLPEGVTLPGSMQPTPAQLASPEPEDAPVPVNNLAALVAQSVTPPQEEEKPDGFRRRRRKA